MFVYLLHFARPISEEHTCQHYLGYTDNLAQRIHEHRCGLGSRLCAVARQRDISFKVVRVWRGGRDLERRLKKRKNSPRLCPFCAASPDPVLAAEELTAAEIELEVMPF